MTIQLEFWPTLAFAIVILSWFVFIVLVLMMNKSAGAPESKRERKSVMGIVLQGTSYALAWSIRRPSFTPILSTNKSLEIGLQFFPCYWR